MSDIKADNIIISPFNEENINPNSYNYHLGGSYIEFPEDYCFDSLNRKSELPPRQFLKEKMLLKTGKLYLFNTFEKIGSKKYVTSLIGKSSLGRLGVFLQISANLGHQGEIHNWTLEIRVCHDIYIYPGMVIGQVTFWQPEGEPFLIDGYYKNFDIPII